MKIAQSARQAIESALLGTEPGTMPSLLLGYTYTQDWHRVPHVEISYLPPEMVEYMTADAAEHGGRMCRDYDGITFIMILSDNDGMLDGRLLTYTNGTFSLKLQ